MSVLLTGRLGNQLFQFAACRALQSHDGPVLVDTRGLGQWTNQLTECMVTGAIQEASVAHRLNLRFRRAKFFEEDFGKAADPRFLSLNPPARLRGYFINEAYFANAAHEVRGAFRPPSTTVVEWIASCRERSEGKPLVAIGVRHGDYVALGYTLPREYYENAVSLLSAEPTDYAWCVFGDDRESNLSFLTEILGKDALVMSGHHLGPVDQLMGMSFFDTLIIPNSTFSWWGAWLADFDHRGSVTVMAPDPWVYLENDYIPERWTKVSRPGGLTRR